MSPKTYSSLTLKELITISSPQYSRMKVDTLVSLTSQNMNYIVMFFKTLGGKFRWIYRKKLT